MRVAVIEEGRVVNLAKADQAWAEANGAVPLPDNSPVDIGWLYNGDGTFSEPPVS